jgi:hypothetical protein
MHYILLRNDISNNALFKSFCPDLMQVLHKGCYIVIKVEVAHSMLNCLFMLMLIRLKNPNVKGLKNIGEVAKERIQMYI